MKNKFIFGFLLVIIAAFLVLVYYLSWMPQPQVSKTGIIPEGLGKWADSEENFSVRTGVPFIFLGFFSGLWIILSKSPKKWWIISWISLFFIVLIAELGQLLLEKRVYDWFDVLWGALGALAGLIISYCFTFLKKFA